MTRTGNLRTSRTHCSARIRPTVRPESARMFTPQVTGRLTLFFFTISDKDVLATIDATARVTAMLEAGRVSLDNHGKGVLIQYPESTGDLDADFLCEPVGIALE